MITSIILATFNGENKIKPAINSILNQTIKNFEFIIIDDGSTDGTLKIIEDFAEKDKRIKIIKNASNIGLTKSLNKGIRFSTGVLIARQDDDDISQPERLETQVNFLQENKEYAFCGCNGILKQNKKEINKYFEYIDIKKNLIVKNCFAHPSIVIRRKILEKYGNYDDKFNYAQDFELWCRFIYKYQLKAKNLREKLIILNNPINKLTEKNKRKILLQSKNRIIIILKYIKYSENKIGGVLSILKLIVKIAYIILFSKEKKT